MATYSDEYLNHYADRYVAARLQAHGVSLEQYLADPASYAALALAPEPLLPAQQAVARRLAAQSAADDERDALAAGIEAEIVGSARLVDGALVEPLRHRRKPQHPGARRRFHRGVA